MKNRPVSYCTWAKEQRLVLHEKGSFDSDNFLLPNVAKNFPFRFCLSRETSQLRTPLVEST